MTFKISSERDGVRIVDLFCVSWPEKKKCRKVLSFLIAVSFVFTMIHIHTGIPIQIAKGGGGAGEGKQYIRRSWVKEQVINLISTHCSDKILVHRRDCHWFLSLSVESVILLLLNITLIPRVLILKTVLLANISLRRLFRKY